MLSLRPQTPLIPNASAHYIPRDAPTDANAISLSAWYASKISEFLRAAPQIPTNLYSLVTSYLNIVNPYPPLPNELIHHIFTIAAQDDAEACRQLCLVSSWTRLMVLPFFMPTVSIRSTNHWALYYYSQDRPHAGWVLPTLFTQNLWIADRIRLGDIEHDAELVQLSVALSRAPAIVRAHTHSIRFPELFRLCPNITALSITPQCLRQAGEQSALHLIHRNVTTLCLQDVFHPAPGDDQLRLLFNGVTTLCAVANTPVDLQNFPKTTHLLVDYCGRADEPLEVMIQELRSCTQLKLIAFGLPNIPEAMKPGEGQCSLAKTLVKATRSDARFAPPSSPIFLSFKSWTRELDYYHTMIR